MFHTPPARGLGALILSSTLVLFSAAALAGPLKGYDASGKAPGDAMFYDPDLNITWTVQGAPSSYVSWEDASAWAGTLSLGGFSSWRLPTMQDVFVSNVGCDDEGNAGTSCGFNVDRSIDTAGKSRSELAYLFHEVLGNKPLVDVNGSFQDTGIFNAGPFTPTLAQDFYWFGTQVSTTESWTFDFLLGYQSTRQNSDGAFAIAVFDGDVGQTAAVPEPASLVLAGTSLLVLALTRRRHHR